MKPWNWTFLAVLLAVAAPGVTARAARLAQGDYAYPELLVEPAWVALHLDDPAVRIVDMRSADPYAAGHIPGAVRMDEGGLRNPEDRLTYLPRPEQLAAMASRAGIGNDTRVVAYDDQGGRMAARLWYVLSAYGHERVSLVNGGWNRWVAEQRPTSKDAPAVTAAKFVPRATPEMTCAASEVLARKPGVVLLDTRSAAEFRGEQATPGAKQPGRIPGAIHLEWKENVTGPHMVFKSGPELRKLYESKGITKDKEIIPY